MKRFLYQKILPYIGLVFIKLLYCTYRVRIINDHIESDIIKIGRRPVYVSWHQRFFPGILFLSARKPIAIIVSRSKDGDLIAKIIEIFGWRPIRGSSSKGGAYALKQVKELAKSGYSLGHIVDGPRGPFGEVKPGLLAMAKTSGMPILPVIISAEKKWIFKSWDKFILPKPFSRIIIKFAEEMYVSTNTKDGLEAYRLQLQEKMHRLYEEADRYWSL